MKKKDDSGAKKDEEVEKKEKEDNDGSWDSMIHVGEAQVAGADNEENREVLGDNGDQSNNDEDDEAVEVLKN